MLENIIIFDMDGVLLKPGGYHESLRTFIKRIGKALGIPNVILSHEQIAHFESKSVTNEWDSLAICTAILLVEVWQIDDDVHLSSLEPLQQATLIHPAGFDRFLENFSEVGNLPGHSAYDLILNENPWLSISQRNHLSILLHHCRDIYKSPTLPGYQETVLGSELFRNIYGLEPKLDIGSFLLKYDLPILTHEKMKVFREWLSSPKNAAGIMTNRPCLTPNGYLSSPEAELGAKLCELEDIPLIGSGLLAWAATTQQSLPDYTFLKPNPVHALALLALVTGSQIKQALDNAASLLMGNGIKKNWSQLNQINVVILEDSIKGLLSGLKAKEMLTQIGIDIKLDLVGISKNTVKRQALKTITDSIYSEINDFDFTNI